MSKNDGGSAFPLPMVLNEVGNIVTSDEYARCGMSLRDYFAAKALLAVETPTPYNMKPNESTAKFKSRRAYAIADAMIAERSKK